MHNFTVPASLKLWIDYVLRVHRSFASTKAGKVGMLKDRPTLAIVSSGGFHMGDKARQPDFLTPYLRHALRTVAITSVEFLYLQGMTGGPAAVDAALTGAHGSVGGLAFGA
jgi:FMN-dependent NADH-azoreductase